MAQNSGEKKEEIRVETEDERGLSRDPARVRVYQGDRLVATITAEIYLDKGADGGLYHCVRLKKQ